jgi:hypothetical protein
MVDLLADLAEEADPHDGASGSERDRAGRDQPGSTPASPHPPPEGCWRMRIRSARCIVDCAARSCRVLAGSAKAHPGDVVTRSQRLDGDRLDQE